MIEKDYIETFHTFFEKFNTQLKKVNSKEESDFLLNISNDYIEKNRDFIMEYPLIDYFNTNTLSKEILIKPFNKRHINIYIHIPFCQNRCSYCNFNIIVWEKNKQLHETLYIKKIENEIKDFLNICPEFTIDTIFIWWGTPSYLSYENFHNLLQMIENHFSPFYKKNLEYTIEANPDSLTEDKIQILSFFRVNRISLWVQTFDEDILFNVWRFYNQKTIFEVIQNLKKYSINNINIDMLYGLPNQTEQKMKNDLNIVSKLDITHITYYPMYYYDNALLNISWNKKDNQKEIYHFYEKIIKNLNKNWFHQYGREYFCKKNLIHKYQSNYISNKLCVWFWNSARSFNGKTSFINQKNLFDYIKNYDTIEKIFTYNKENILKRKLILWIRHNKIKKVNTKNFDKYGENLKMLEKIRCIKISWKDILLTKKWTKYQEFILHSFL